MSAAPVTEAHIALSARITQENGYNPESTWNRPLVLRDAQLIADSEARACAYLIGRLDRVEREVERRRKAMADEAIALRDMMGERDAAEAESIQLKKANIENADAYRLMQGRVIAAERDHDETRERALTLADSLDKAEAELAAERARLDWLEGNANDIMKYNCRSYIWFAHQNLRAAIDAAMKEEAK